MILTLVNEPKNKGDERSMTNRNPKFESKNQGAPTSNHQDVEFGQEIASGDNNKGKKYRSKIGSKSKVTKGKRENGKESM